MQDSPNRDDQLLTNIHARWPELAELLDEVSSLWVYEDLVYRFYHQSFKVYALQNETKRIVEMLQRVAPNETTFSPMFEEIFQAGASGKKFEAAHNQEWTVHTRIFLEVFFHAKFFLEMAVKYGKELSAAPTSLPAGWAALLCLYNLR